VGCGLTFDGPSEATAAQRASAHSRGCGPKEVWQFAPGRQQPVRLATNERQNACCWNSVLFGLLSSPSFAVQIVQSARHMTRDLPRRLGRLLEPEAISTVLGFLYHGPCALILCHMLERLDMTGSQPVDMTVLFDAITGTEIDAPTEDAPEGFIRAQVDSGAVYERIRGLWPGVFPFVGRLTRQAFACKCGHK
jgi:hypothetical protein